MDKRFWECRPEICHNACVCTTGNAHDPKPTSCLFESGYQQNWVEVTLKYQITEVLEPAYYLDMQPPKDMGREAEKFAMMLKHNSKEIEVYSEGQLRIKSEPFHFSGVPSSWIKQKQPELTHEELQRKIGIINKIADLVYSDMVFTQFLPEQIKQILAGEK